MSFGATLCRLGGKPQPMEVLIPLSSAMVLPLCWSHKLSGHEDNVPKMFMELPARYKALWEYSIWSKTQTLPSRNVISAWEK